MLRLQQTNDKNNWEIYRIYIMATINCPTCSTEMPGFALSCPKCGRPTGIGLGQFQPVSAPLKVGIFLVPLIFAWFTLGKEYTSKTKVISFAWLVFSLAIIGMLGFQNISSTNGQKGSIVGVAPIEIMQVKIGDILSSYKINEAEADIAYKGNWIEVTGLVDNIKKDLSGNIYITIGTGQKIETPKIQAFFDGANDQLTNVSKRQRLRVVCRIDGLMINVIAKDCVLN